MRILAIVPSIYDTNPSQRYRIEQWEPLLGERGVEITYKPFESEALHDVLYKQGHVGEKLRHAAEALVRRAGDVRGAREFDAVYVLREAALLGPAFFERWLAFAGVPYVFDFDDAVFVPYVSPSNGYLSYLKFPGKTRAICRMAAHVMAGNEYLADYARRVHDRGRREVHGRAARAERRARHRLEREPQHRASPLDAEERPAPSGGARALP